MSARNIKASSPSYNELAAERDGLRKDIERQAASLNEWRAACKTRDDKIVSLKHKIAGLIQDVARLNGYRERVMEMEAPPERRNTERRRQLLHTGDEYRSWSGERGAKQEWYE